MTDDELERAAAALRARLKGPDASLDDRVMAAIGRQSPVVRRPSVVRRLFAPSVRIPPVFIPLAAAALLVMWFAGTRFGSGPGGPVAPPVVAAAPASDTVYVRFELRQPDASAVHLAGDFNEWAPGAIPLVRSDGGVWSVTLPMTVGQHAYQFIVDGERWVPDPEAAVVDDGFGGRNSVIVVGPKGVVRS
jgi:hypothetical protein